jgi:hypothetical protein
MNEVYSLNYSVTMMKYNIFTFLLSILNRSLSPNTDLPFTLFFPLKFKLISISITYGRQEMKPFILIIQILAHDLLSSSTQSYQQQVQLVQTPLLLLSHSHLSLSLASQSKDKR